MINMIIILICISFLAMLIPMLALDDPDWKHISLIIAIICSMWATLMMSEERYKQGQIDAINDDVKYEMKIDSTTTVDTTYTKKND